MINSVKCESYTTKEVAEILGVSPRTIMKMRRRKDGPPFKKIGAKLIRYPKDQFETWKANLG